MNKCPPVTVLLLICGCAAAGPAGSTSPADSPPLAAPATRPVGEVELADIPLAGAASDLAEYRAAAREAGLSDADVAFVDGVVADQQHLLDDYGGKVNEQAEEYGLKPASMAVEIRNAVQSRANDAVAKRPAVYEPWLKVLGRHQLLELAALQSPGVISVWLRDAGVPAASVAKAMVIVRQAHADLAAAADATRGKSATPADGLYFLRREAEAKRNVLPQVTAAVPPDLRAKWTAHLDGLLLDGTALHLDLIAYNHRKHPSETAPPTAAITSEDLIAPDIPPGTYELLAVGDAKVVETATVGKGQSVGFMIGPDLAVINAFAGEGKAPIYLGDHLYYWRKKAGGK